MTDWLYSQRAQLTLALVLFATMTAFWIWGIGSEQALLANQAPSVEKARIALTQTQAEGARVTAVLDRYQHNLREIASFREKYLQKKPERIAAISEAIAALAEENRIALEEVRYSLNLSTNRDLQVYHIDLPLSGRFNDIRQFIFGIESSPHFLTISRIEVEESSDFEGAVRANLALATYFAGETP